MPAAHTSPRRPGACGRTGAPPRPRAHRSRVLREERGQSLIEFALVMPLLLILVLGIIQFGFALHSYIALTDAVRIGARQAAVSRSINPESSRVPLIVSKVEKAGVNLDKNKLTVTVTPWDPVNNVSGWVQSGDVTVTGEYPYTINILGLTVFNGKITSRTIERVE
jgi:Flp pilus assembly protein TadG